MKLRNFFGEREQKLRLSLCAGCVIASDDSQKSVSRLMFNSQDDRRWTDQGTRFKLPVPGRFQWGWRMSEHEKSVSQDAFDSENGHSRNDVSKRMLESVLEQTALLSSDASETRADIASLRPVAAKHAGQKLDGDILCELVRAMLSRVFSNSSDAIWEPMSATIASSIQDDPGALARVERLWGQLSETEK